MKFLSLRKTALTFLPALLIAGGLVFTSLTKSVFAQALIPVTQLHEKAMHRDAVMCPVEKLPAAAIRLPLAT